MQHLYLQNWDKVVDAGMKLEGDENVEMKMLLSDGDEQSFTFFRTY